MSWNFGFTSGSGSNGGGDNSGDGGGFLDGYSLSDAIDQGLQGWQIYNNQQLAQQALNSPRPATVTFLPNGQAAVATGGGAVLPSLNSFTSAFTSIPSWAVLLFFALLILFMVHKR